MDAKSRGSLERLAQERLDATATGDEEYSFLFRTPGATDLTYCPWSAVDPEGFDGDVDGMDLPWPPERIDLIKSGENPTAAELLQWQVARCRQLAEGSDWSVPAWIVPIWVDGAVTGFALFLCETETPRLAGVHETVEAAKKALAAEGAIANR